MHRSHAIKSIAALGLLALVPSVLAGCAAESPAPQTDNSEVEAVHLRLATPFNDSNVHTIGGTNFFLERVAELADERGLEINIEYFGDGQLGTAPEMFDVVRTGTADIASSTLSLVTTEIPEAEVAQLPGSFNSADEGSRAFWELIQQRLLPKFEEKGLVPLFGSCAEPYNIFTASKPVTELADMQGLLLRSSGGGLSLAIEAIGAVPVEMPAADIYLGMQRGTIDGTVSPMGSLPAFKLEEVTKYGTNNMALGSGCTAWMINAGVWSGLPEEVQEVLSEAGAATVGNVGAYFDSQVDGGREILIQAGAEVSDVEDIDKVNALLAPLMDDWAVEMDSRGLDGTGMVEAWREILSSN